MFRSLLIANRGEIACRIIRTARRMGLRTIAIHSDADSEAMHVAQADLAVRIGPPPARESYLAVENILLAARETGAEAVHPGYGFLSENAEFAEACASAGLIFVGPPPEAMRAMGSKSRAKAIMGNAGVPLVPGYHGDIQSLAAIAKEAKRIGYPVLIKASAGGGGKGMRKVDSEDGFQGALDAAKREAAAAFGDDRVLVEKYLTRPRHVEVQVFADAHGNAIHLFERDCSVQRRHQKVIEEAPAPDLEGPLRSALGTAAVTAARAIGYVGAGTVEFILEEGSFYFMEMNTRLQVEHPVTEMITGLDLVEWQLRVAAGEPLPLAAEDVVSRGHAIEVRLYAEDPARDFLPTGGRISFLHLPEEPPAVRVDTGVRAGDLIGLHYDPMIAKLIAWGEDRPAAIRRMNGALTRCRIGGVTTNLNLLLAITNHDTFTSGAVDTGFIERHRDELVGKTLPPDAALAVAALALIQERREGAREAARSGADPYSPWHQVTGWRLNGEARRPLAFQDALGRRLDVMVHFRGTRFLIDLPGGAVEAEVAPAEDGVLPIRIGDQRSRTPALREGDQISVFVEGRWWQLQVLDPLAGAGEGVAGAGRLTAPMPGRIAAVGVRLGDRVGRGTTLMALEAMKMEHAIIAPSDGVVAAIHYTVGDLVEDGAELIVLEAAEG
ncbi:MAG TPA: acetyl/propionyl/methylcrotonyl-CoA carboxylase subunit alpha [Alphaproteobacteria bacterium]|nr:acetyl/propionyl/methylcrotonyl-CoA carboxylase subunit alpha [Alphaproteobacteria bacterium]